VVAFRAAGKIFAPRRWGSEQGASGASARFNSGSDLSMSAVSQFRLGGIECARIAGVEGFLVREYNKHYYKILARKRSNGSGNYKSVKMSWNNISWVLCFSDEMKNACS